MKGVLDCQQELPIQALAGEFKSGWFVIGLAKSSGNLHQF